ncbi:hypothetical protein INT47_005557 [Mucor saturninus]|uniref:Mtf2-like C-terminal domain-containing protein n=1 Tax=Mucor saturninus TaxID=64648 RepID=A0A8H7RF85_9FUNG|nr:hypothetical protein INT47_005557 [Mucor saturninus]
MIPCRLHSRFLLKRAFNLHKQAPVFAKHFYSTPSHDSTESSSPNSTESSSPNSTESSSLNNTESSSPDNTAAAPSTNDSSQKTNFWEIPEREESETHNKGVKARVSRTVADTRDFKELLDTLFDRKPAQTPPMRKKPQGHDTDSVIEQKLLDLVIRNRQLYKEKAPLPRSMMAPIYGKTADKQRKQKREEESNDEDEDVLDFLNPDTKKTTNWDLKNIAQNKRIATKEQELKAIQSIVDTETSLDLLVNVMKQINQETYPRYYHRVLTKAIEHASRKDPYLALTIFEIAKGKSMESYILGCNTKVYDAMLLLRWETWRDVHGMLNLIEEMTVNGIEYSNDSRRIVRSVVQEIEADEESQEVTKDVYWDADEKRACNVMKEMVGKWILNK